jgi:hypothetical protein
MSTSKHIKYNSAFSLRNWETDDTQSFISETKTGVSPTWSPTSQSRAILSKHRPQTAKARKEPSGWRNPTPFQAYVCRIHTGGAFEYEAENASGTKVMHRGGTGYNPPSSTCNIFMGTSGAGRFPRTSTSLVNRSITEAILKIKADVINVAEDLATFNQTLGTIADVITQLKNLWNIFNFKNIQRRKLWDEANYAYIRAEAKRSRRRYLHGSGSPNITRAAARRRAFFRQWGLPPAKPPAKWYPAKGDLWLQLQYAWKPLVSDIVAAWSAAKGLPRPIVTATRHLEESEALPYAPATAGAFFRAEGFIRSGAHTRVDSELTSSGLALLDSFSLLNPFSLGWELLPYSFVIDWLIPFGSVINQLSVPLSHTLRGISTTRFTVTNVQFQWTQFKNYKSGSMITSTVSSLATYRTASFFWPGPMPYIKSPFTPTRAVTAIALLHQVK